jgi:H+-transporting ATPase
MRLLDGGYLSVDQSALTGESLPIDRKANDAAYSCSVALGEMKAVITETRKG